jgi:hypothetical protein
MDYILANLVPSEDTVSVPLSVLSATVLEQPEDDDEYIENGEVTKSQPNCLPMKPLKGVKNVRFTEFQQLHEVHETG